MRVGLAEVLQAHQGDVLVDALLALLAVQRLVDQAQGDVLRHAQPGEQAVLLKNDAAFAADAIERLAVDQDLPLVVVVQADQQAQQGRFTAATGADDGDELTVGDLQVEVADASSSPPATAKCLPT